MSDKTEHTGSYDPIMDTQRLLQGAEPPAGGDFDLESILAEYGAGSARPRHSAEEAESPPASRPPAEGGHGNVLTFPAPAAEAEEEHGQEQEEPALRADNEIDSISPEELFGLPVREEEIWEPPAGEEADARPPEATPEPPAAESSEEDGEELPPVSMEDIVASTVDAVKEEQKRRQEKVRRRIEKVQKKQSRKPAKRRDPALRQPLPEGSDEPSPRETAAYYKGRYFVCRKSLLLSLPVLLLLWAPWILEQFGVEIPFFSESRGNRAICVLVPQVIFCILCWPVFRAAREKLRERACTICLLAAAANIVTILDAATLLLLPERTGVAPLGGVAAVIAFFSLWGLTRYHRGMWETFRIAAMGQPGYLVDCGEAGIVKGRGFLTGFYTRASMEDTSSQWQRLLMPVLLTASLVFAVLASVGQGRNQDLVWCWSLILCAGGSLAFPLAFCVPFGRLAVRLASSGAAVAGQYGAAVLTASRQIVVTDTDLFPQGTVALNGLKLYGEERSRAISYAATLAVRAGGSIGHVFEEICRTDRISYQPLEHFHIHDDNGLSGMIHGETVLVGTAMFMRHMAVRLPAAMPSKTAVCLAVDGALTAVFSVKYNTSAPVESALRALSRNRLQLTLAVRDGNITPKLLKTRFGADGGAVCPELSERLALSDPDREADAPNGLLYRDGLYPFVDMVAGSRRLCQVVRVGTLLSVLSSVSGMLLAFYLAFSGSFAVLTPVLLLTYLLLWVVPLVPLLWGVDRT